MVEDLSEKAEMLGALMRKLQPAGGYAPITPDDADYIPRLKGVSVVKIAVEEISAKFKFGLIVDESYRPVLFFA